MSKHIPSNHYALEGGEFIPIKIHSFTDQNGKPVKIDDCLKIFYLVKEGRVVLLYKEKSRMTTYLNITKINYEKNTETA